MYELDLDGLKQLIQEGRVGADYAWEHRDELAAREHIYTLYGPHEPPLGASIPSSLTSAKSRKLQKSTRRKTYTIYELDASYKPLRTIDVIDHNVDCVYHHFELNGITYAYIFSKYGRSEYFDSIYVLKYQDGRPIYFAETTESRIVAEFYEYIEPGRMGVSCYSCALKATHNRQGCLIDWNAPVGAVNSPVSRHYREEPIQYIDFSYWFKEK